MKLNKWLLGAMAFSLLTACSDNDLADKNVNGGNDKPFTDGAGYIGINLQLPQESSTRGLNDQFQDGLAWEYNIKHAALFLFVGDPANEAEAQFFGAYKINPDARFDQPNGDNITVSFQKTAELDRKPEIQGNNKLLGLVILNYDESYFKFEVDGEKGALTVGGEAFNRIGDEGTIRKFSDFQNIIRDVTFIRHNKTTGIADGICMSNAPLSTTPAGQGQHTIRILAELDHNQIKENTTEAELSPAGCVFVERAVAKVTIDKFPAFVELDYTKVELDDNGAAKPSDAGKTELKIKQVEWIIDNEEPTSYLVRNVAKLDEWWKSSDLMTGEKFDWGMASVGTVGNPCYRMVGSASMADIVNGSYDSNTGVHEKRFRTYWCADPTYGSSRPFNDIANAAIVDSENSKYKFTGLSSVAKDGKVVHYESLRAFYPHENTFAVKEQDYRNTTRVVFRVKYGVMDNDNAQLYAMENELNTFYLEEDAENLLKSALIASGQIHDYILAHKNVDNVAYNHNDFDIDFGIGYKNDDGDKVLFKDEAERKAYTGKKYLMIEKVAIKKDGQLYGKLNLKDADGKDIILSSDQENADTDQYFTNAIDHSNSGRDIVLFEDNECYYAVNVKHFGDDYCYIDEATMKGDKTYQIYGTDEKATEQYLGRWGMVRNNWYSLSVDIIRNLGLSTVPNGNVDKSDDNKEENFYISARVHILSWAKRLQQVDF